MAPLAQGLSQGCSQGTNCGLISNLSWERICIQAPVVLGRIYFLMGCWTDGLICCFLSMRRYIFTSFAMWVLCRTAHNIAAHFIKVSKRESTSKTIVTVLENIIMEVIFLCLILLVRSIAPVIPRIKGRWLLLEVGIIWDHFRPVCCTAKLFSKVLLTFDTATNKVCGF